MKYLFILSLFFCLCCTKNKELVSHQKHIVLKSKLSDSLLKDWYYKDIERDTIPGISLDRTFNEFLNIQKSEEVIIAIIDNPMAINDKQLINYIWKNTDEIKNNEIDDDSNGYIDDVNGWNFLGNKNGEVAQVQLQSCVRALKKYNPRFKDKAREDIPKKDSIQYLEYLNVKKAYEDQVKFANEEVEYAAMIRGILTSTKKLMNTYFGNAKYTIEDLDSLKTAYPKDTLLHKQIFKRSNFIKYGFTDAYISNYEKVSANRLYKTLSSGFNEREIQQDDPNDINDKNYGNNLVDKYTEEFTHGTRVAGPIALLQDYFQLPSNIKIMPIAVSAYGAYYEKDIALAIHYAVDNGAKVINMSFSVDYYYNKEWVPLAIKYAEKNNVLIITSAGNSNINIDEKETPYYPNDIDEITKKEFASNFITVGSSTHNLSNKLKSSFSNFGKTNVDVFAPGDSIYTTFPDNKYRFERGTSMASSVTSSVAALLFSYYPTLTATQVKQIIMDSGVEYTIPVSVPTEENPDQLIPFNQLSKSGKIINAYNAFIMADSVVNATKRRR